MTPPHNDNSNTASPNKASLNVRFERAAADMFWVPEGVTVVERPEIIYTASPEPNLALNTVAYVRASNAQQSTQLVHEVAQAHPQGSSRWALCAHAPAVGLRQALQAAGYREGHAHDLMVLPLAVGSDHETRLRPGPYTAQRVETLQHLRDAYMVGARAFQKNTPPPTDVQLTAELERTIHPEGRVARFVVYAGGQPISAGGVTLHRSLGLGMMWAGGTVPTHRRRGAYRLLLQARIDWVSTFAHVDHIGFYARLNTSAPIVARYGFERHGRMTYWER
ncbi:MAG: hypothetical protein AAFS10_23205 [Myxococcota bacterium]